MLWKKKLQAGQEAANIRYEKGNASVVGVHELYENDELLQDWKDVYITSAYLVWCQTSKVFITFWLTFTYYYANRKRKKTRY